MIRACSTQGSNGKCIQSLVGNLEGKRPIGSPMHRWEGNIKMVLKEIDSSGLREGPLVGYNEHGKKPFGSIQGKEFLD
jgi:hypothetical protein